MTIEQTLALALGVGWASGVNLYAAVFMLGILGATGNIVLPENLQVLTHPAVLTVAGVMFLAEFFADKIPGVDSAWDAIHTFIRIPAGAVLAAGAIGPVDPAIQLAAGLVGGSLAATSHATKTGARLLINTSPEPVSNWTASIAEDAAVIGGLWMALNYPWLFFGCLAIVVLIMAILLPKMWRLFRKVLAKVFGARRPIAAEVPSNA
ncbi:MAG: DUF4126 domain-containing protein [Deltaproteobacteria bacterium]|nr:DUF4126 domain-containing protein [Deltaproteobacteria bacterium]